MGHFTVVKGGNFVSPQRWVARLQSSGCRVELRPDDDAARLGGEVWVRFGHPEIADDRDLLLLVDVIHAWPALDAPPEMLEGRRAFLARLQELNAPPSLIAETSVIVQWLSRGREGVVEELTKIIAERRGDGDPDEHLTHELADLAFWQKADAAAPQRVEFRGVGGFVAKLIAEQLLAISYAVESGAEVTNSALHWSPDLAARLVEAFFVAKESWGWSDKEDVYADEYFQGWDNVPQTDPEDGW